MNEKESPVPAPTTLIQPPAPEIETENVHDKRIRVRREQLEREAAEREKQK